MMAIATHEDNIALMLKEYTKGYVIGESLSKPTIGGLW